MQPALAGPPSAHAAAVARVLAARCTRTHHLDDLGLAARLSLQGEYVLGQHHARHHRAHTGARHRAHPRHGRAVHGQARVRPARQPEDRRLRAQGRGTTPHTNPELRPARWRLRRPRPGEAWGGAVGRGQRVPSPEPRPYLRGGTSSDPDARAAPVKTRKETSVIRGFETSNADVVQNPSAPDARLFL